MPGDIDVHFDAQAGRLWLNCGPAAFARILSAISSEVDLAALEIEGGLAAVHSIDVCQPTVPQPPTAGSDRILLIGCGLAGFVVLFLMAMGLGTLAGWVR